MAKFKVGDLVRRVSGGLAGMSIGDVDTVVALNSTGASGIELKRFGVGHHAPYFELVESNTTGPQECPTIIKVSQTFTLQIKNITIQLDRSEIDELIKQLNEVY